MFCDFCSEKLSKREKRFDSKDSSNYFTKQNVMKKIWIILGLLLIAWLASCSTADNADTTNTGALNNDTTLETNSWSDMAELTWSVVLDTNHALAGKTLIFEVEMVSITKSGSGATADVVESWDTVDVHYKGTLKEDGSMFDSSYDRGETLSFTVWEWQMISGFDSGVVGMKQGEKKTLELAPADAYGEFDEERKQVVPKSDLASFVAAGYELEVGEKLPTQFGEFEIIEILPEGATGATDTSAQ